VVPSGLRSLLRIGPGPDEGGDRIRSLAQAHDLLIATNWKPTSLQALLRTEIGAYTLARGRLEFVGPDVMLEPRAFSAMALVLHELVTNARKYGALTTPNGKITIETVVDEIDNVAVTWRETGGPPVTPPLAPRTERATLFNTLAVL
jgi:two-component sensor histidine kinase